MADAIKCSLDIRRVPESSYARPTDGRKGGAVCSRRRALMQQLASYANPDGSGITVSIERLCDEMGWSRRTVFRILDDFEEMGFISNEKLTKWNGTRTRRINVKAILAAIAVPDSRPVDVPDSRPVDVPDTAVGVPDSSGVVVPDSFCRSAKQHLQECQIADETTAKPAIWHTTVNQPYTNRPPTDGAPSALAADGWEEVVENLPATMKKETALLVKADLQTFKALVAEHGAALIIATVAHWIDTRPLSIEGLKQLKCRAFLNEYKPYLEEARGKTPEGRAKAAAAENQAVEDAMANARRIAKQKERHPVEEEISVEEQLHMLREAK
jgi:hypothetical protein